MKCVICNKEEKKWYICETCFEVLRKKYPDYRDLIRVIKQHRKEQLRREE